jgi:polyphosphate kinase 2 (PPK2 family)
LARLQVELVKLQQQWVIHEKKKICIVFEGRDASAKAA